MRTHSRRGLLLAPLLVTALSLGSAPQRAHADSDSRDDVADFTRSIPWEKIGINAIQRARRSIAIGPLAGVAGVLPTEGDPDAAISIGLGLSTYKINVIPDKDAITAILKNRFKERLKEKLKDGFKNALMGGRPDKEEARSLAREIWDDILNEFIEERRTRRIEPPRFRIQVEGARTLSSKDFSARAGIGMGLGPVSLGANLSGLFADENVLLLGPEVSLQLLYGTQRTRVVDLFGRVDFPAVNGDGAIMSVGARVLLDLI